MIKSEDIMPMAYFKKEPFLGSDRGMRFRIEKHEVEQGEDKTTYLKLTVWPQPYSYECTDKELMVSELLPFNEEGRAQILPWLQAAYEERKEMYEEAAKL